MKNFSRDGAAAAAAAMGRCWLSFSSDPAGEEKAIQMKSEQRLCLQFGGCEVNSDAVRRALLDSLKLTDPLSVLGALPPL